MPCFMGFLAFFMLTECVFEGFPPNSCRPHPDIEQSDVFFFFSVQWAEPFSTCKNTWELSYLGILFRLLTLAIQGGLETLGHKDTVCTGGLAPLQWEHTCVTQNPTHKPTPSPLNLPYTFPVHAHICHCLQIKTIWWLAHSRWIIKWESTVYKISCCN